MLPCIAHRNGGHTDYRHQISTKSATRPLTTPHTPRSTLMLANATLALSAWRCLLSVARGRRMGIYS